MKVIQLLLSLPLVSAFTTTSLQKSAFSSSSHLHHAAHHEASSSSRRTFFSTAAILATVMTKRPLPSAADDIDDLAMPAEEEQKIQNVSFSILPWLPSLNHEWHEWRTPCCYVHAVWRFSSSSNNPDKNSTLPRDATTSIMVVDLGPFIG